jgi:hypothetical protein
MTSASASQSISVGRTDDVPPSWDERTILTTFLDYARDTVHAKCAGLAEADDDIRAGQPPALGRKLVD